MDVLCINQADDIEKTGQVCLMSRIYAMAQKTVICLSANKDIVSTSAGAETDRILDPGDVTKPLPPDFGGFGIDNDDFVTLLHLIEWPRSEDSKTLSPDDTIVASLLIARSLYAIMAHPWWERMWTLQEAILPKTPPVFNFRGFQFTWQHVDLAMLFLVNLKEKQLPSSLRGSVDQEKLSFVHKDMISSGIRGNGRCRRTVSDASFLFPSPSLYSDISENSRLTISFHGP
jgi:hypothetical protein